jgi:TatD DNase family protein
MDMPYINIHTHRRMGKGVEVVSVMAGRGAREAAGVAVLKGDARATALGGTASVESDLPAPPFSIGVHPWQLDDNGFDPAEALREVEIAPAAAIGEIGLDHAITVDRDKQTAVFAAQLRIAEVRRLPVVLHCVRAFEPVMEMLSGFRLSGVIFHGFIGQPEQAARAIEAGYCLSFGERSLSSPKTVETLRNTPLENLFLETDDAPTPIAEIYSRAAEIMNIPRETLAQTIYENYERLVGTH